MNPEINSKISMRNIVKKFGGVKALDHANLEIADGEIHAIVGENGAGKSTLMNILYGVFKPEEGQIFLKNRERKFKGPRDAIKCGIGMVHQHFSLIPAFTVEEDITLGSEYIKKGFFLDSQKAQKEIRALFDELGIDINPKTIIRDLPLSAQQKVEIVKTLYRGIDTLILDEPTSVLTPQETDTFFHTILNLRKKGLTIILITHKLDEVKFISERLTVLRDGKTIGTRITNDINPQEIADMMVGRNVVLKKEKSVSVISELLSREPVLKIDNLSVQSKKTKLDSLKNISLEIYPGEVLGIAGVNGNGQTDLINALCGIEERYSGDIILSGSSLKDKSCRKRLEIGLAHIPDDRIRDGIITEMTLKENFLLGKHRDNIFGNIFFLSSRKISGHAKALTEKYDIRPRDLSLKSGSFSGGNQQKIVIARELSRNASLIIAAQPTRGVDIGAIEFIHSALLEKRNAGAAILLVSTELSEIMSLSDRISVMYRGNLSAPRPANELDENTIGMMMLGEI